VGFARGLNDAPKIAALALVGTAFSFSQIVVLVAGAMLLGGMLGARRVARTMSHRITTMNDGQGCTANLVTAALVMTGSAASLPLSTTHVSCGALFGLGAVTGGARRRMIVGIVSSWFGTLPLAAALAALCYLLVQ
jgi:PiT family inorganic phosphate transporter